MSPRYEKCSIAASVEEECRCAVKYLFLEVGGGGDVGYEECGTWYNLVSLVWIGLDCIALAELRYFGFGCGGEWAC